MISSQLLGQSSNCTSVGKGQKPSYTLRQNPEKQKVLNILHPPPEILGFITGHEGSAYLLHILLSPVIDVATRGALGANDP